MSDKHEEIQKKGIRLVVIGNGSVDQARFFKEEQQIEFDLWVDPDMTAYAAAGLRRGLTGIFSPKIIGNAFRAKRGGFRQTEVQGDPWQLGGIFLINTDGRILYHHVSRVAGDHPTVDEILTTVDLATHRKKK